MAPRRHREPDPTPDPIPEDGDGPGHGTPADPVGEDHPTPGPAGATAVASAARGEGAEAPDGEPVGGSDEGSGEVTATAPRGNAGEEPGDRAAPGDGGGLTDPSSGESSSEADGPTPAPRARRGPRRRSSAPPPRTGPTASVPDETARGATVAAPVTTPGGATPGDRSGDEGPGRPLGPLDGDTLGPADEVARDGDESGAGGSGDDVQGSDGDARGDSHSDDGDDDLAEFRRWWDPLADVVADHPRTLAVVALVLVAAALVAASVHVGSRPVPPSPNTTVAPTTTTTEPGPTTTDPGPRPADVGGPVPRREVVEASGECGDTIGALRDLFTEQPASSRLDTPGTVRLNALLGDLEARCDAGTAETFRRTELDAWLHHLPTG